MSNGELVRRGFEAARRGDLDALRELLHPDVRWHGGDPSAAGACANCEQALGVMGEARARGPLPELVDVIEAGEKVVVVLRHASGEGEGAIRANLTTFRDGRVVEMVHFPRLADALAAARVPG